MTNPQQSDVIYHIALADDWAAAQAAGEYRMSTRGRTLADEGFIHASFADQVTPTLDRFYRDMTSPLVLLVIDRAALDVEVRLEEPAPSAGLFPHIYGPLPADAVRDVWPLQRNAAGDICVPNLDGAS